MAGSDNLSVLLQSQRVSSTSDPLDTLFIPCSSTSSFLASVSGTRSMVSFDGADQNRSFFSTFDEDDDIDEYLHRPEKKRRLTVEQVQFLEKSFEVENKLEPERKIQLAKDLGLQSRQVAIWFQNRRARWKSKQLEKDYDSLQASYNSLKTDYDDLLKEKDKLKQEVLELTDKLSMKGKDKGNSELDSKAVVLVDETASEVEESKVSVASAKSDRFDSDKDSPHNTDHGVHSSLLDQSDLSQDEEDDLSKATLLHIPSYIFPKLEDDDYSDPPASSCNFGLPVDDHAFWSWAY